MFLINMPLENKNMSGLTTLTLWILNKIMVHSKLPHNYLKSRSNKDRKAYKKQRNLCVNLLRYKKIDYLDALDLRSVTGLAMNKPKSMLLKASSFQKLLKFYTWSVKYT